MCPGAPTETFCFPERVLQHTLLLPVAVTVQQGESDAHYSQLWAILFYGKQPTPKTAPRNLWAIGLFPGGTWALCALKEMTP